MSNKNNKIDANQFLAMLLQYSRDFHYNHINVSVRLNRNPAYTRQVMNIKLKRISKKYGNDERLYAAMTADEGQAFLLLMNKLKEEMFANFSQKITWHTDLLDRNDQEFGYRQIRERDQYNNLEFEINL
ncbi:hypothetical protein [Weissella sagaensis]|jgi:hypothetical protein|uniref:Uncharacterized protein n=1 Tax=Weissella sagaensis TaxID=2559928 RepID=A0ABW1RQV8_9LACO|nr:hypothetical protein [Weissella sagaensis]KAA8431471.1 hypothetical protein FKV79_08775 [Weissella paramesenteroides]MBU7569004.1 hypothetical protein [Weissella hellenica]KAA8435738.1 hypothetical protein FKV73_08770 [Weissella paramesenteroides]QEA57318.1 hypothetical protein FGL75_05310 [Weissella hellenica]UEG66430.1 hypothetical protein GZH44_06575 [Weissella hellenica]